VSVNFDQVREIAGAYEDAVRANAAGEDRDLQTEALAAIVGAAKCIAYPLDGLDGLIKAAALDAKDKS
jgi:hypothetical protein